MTMRVNYIGSDDFRIVRRTDMVSRGLSDPGQDLVWSKLNSYELDLPNDVAAFLLAYSGEFADDDSLSFGAAVREAFSGRLLGVAELQLAQTNATSTMALIPGAQVEVECSGKPLRVAFDFPSSNSTTGQGGNYLMEESLDGVTFASINTALAFAGSIANLVMLYSIMATRTPAAGLVVYRMKFARFTSGTVSCGSSTGIPATLSVTEL